MLDAALRSRAVAIISAHNANGTIIALSPEAGQEGLCKGMKVSLARKMSPTTRLLSYNRSLYSRMHHYLYQTITTFSPLVEPAVFGQFYIDMTGMWSVQRIIKKKSIGSLNFKNRLKSLFNCKLFDVSSS